MDIIKARHDKRNEQINTIRLSILNALGAVNPATGEKEYREIWFDMIIREAAKKFGITPRTAKEYIHAALDLIGAETDERGRIMMAKDRKKPGVVLE